MSEHFRKNKRISLEGRGLKGEFIIHPDPQPVAVELLDISDDGAGVRLAEQTSEEKKQILRLMVRNAQTGKKIPIQFLFNNYRIPVVLLNNWEDDCYGFAISESGHQQLAALAGKGRDFFQNLVQGAMRTGGAEAQYKNYEILSMEGLPPVIANFVESRDFIAVFMPVLASTILENVPSIKKAVSSLQDVQHLQAVLFRFLKQQGKDVRLIIGSGIHYLHQEQREAPLDTLIAPATKYLFDDNRILSFEDQARLRDLFVQELSARRKTSEAKEAKAAREAAAAEAAAAPAGTPAAAPAIPTATATAGTAAGITGLRSVPENHPMADLIKVRFDTFNRKVFFIQKLVPIVTDHYFNKFLQRDHEMMEIAQDDQNLTKKLLPRWVQNELQEIATSKERKMQGVIEEQFRLAMFEYILRRRVQNITHEEIFDLLEGKIAPELADTRDRFLNTVCEMINAEVMIRFGDYRDDIDFERAQKRAEKDEELRIAKLPPPALVKEFLWPKVVDLGFIKPLHREYAKAWMQNEKQLISLNALGGVVVIPPDSYAEFSSLVAKYARDGDKPQDFFDMVDLFDLYNRTVEQRDGTKVKDVFGMYVDTLTPNVARENIVDKVLKNPANCRYYVLNKSKSFFSKSFGVKSVEAITFVERAMLTVQQAVENFV